MFIEYLELLKIDLVPSELGVYEMTQDGLREVNNPSEILISDRDEETSGVAMLYN